MLETLKYPCDPLYRSQAVQETVSDNNIELEGLELQLVDVLHAPFNGGCGPSFPTVGNGHGRDVHRKHCASVGSHVRGVLPFSAASVKSAKALIGPNSLPKIDDQTRGFAAPETWTGAVAVVVAAVRFCHKPTSLIRAPIVARY